MLQLLIIISSFLAILVVMFVILLTQYRASKLQEQKLKQQLEAATLITRKNRRLIHLADKLESKITEDKMYINSDLSINEVAVVVGTNRSYLSYIINHIFHLSFPTYINLFRVEEVAKLIVSGNDYSSYELAIRSGFGSVDTMKRAIKANTGLTLNEWKDELLKKEALKDS